MKRIFIFTSLFTCAFFVFSACSKTRLAANPNTISLHNCSEEQAKKQPYICFDSVVTDSRCPEDVTCIWSGYAMINVSFHENDNTHSFKMMTPAVNKSFGGVNDTTINGYKIKFEDLLPHHKSSTPAPMPSQIQAVITITK